MPFDSTGIFAPSPLSKLGITPVSSWVVEAHKAKVLQEYLTTPHRLRPHDPAYAEWTIRRGHAGWRSISGLSWALIKYIQGEKKSWRELPRMPVALMRIAHAARSGTFEIEYFNDDPILNVRWEDGSRECLGIWDESGIVEIAGYERQSWWSRVWRRS